MLADDGVRLPGARRAALAATANERGIEVPAALASAAHGARRRS
jgi:LDH2 family malate/lactate/ureidoglycolate dehydrogenase